MVQTDTRIKETGIIFSGESVRAILDGRKTMTRRVCKPQPQTDRPSLMPDGSLCGLLPSDGAPVGNRPPPKRGWMKSPYGPVGSRLWVREAWYDATPHNSPYRADYDAGQDLPKVARAGGWKSPLFMPRSLSRITLEITFLCVERLQTISPEDAIAEGCMPDRESGLGTPENFREASRLVGGPYPRGIFAMLWNRMNRANPWESNPWVWAVGFRKVENGD